MEKKVLFINHIEKQCGVHQFGENVFAAITLSEKFQFIYSECSEYSHLLAAVQLHNPAAIIYNYYASTLPWLNPGITRRMKFPQLGIMHEVTQERVNHADKVLFDFHIAPDPTVLLTNPIVFKTGRLIPSHKTLIPPPPELTIGSFGFGTKGKGYPHIIEAVQKEFDKAIIRLNIPFATFGDAEGSGAKAYAEKCRELITKPGISLQITHDFLSQEEVLNFLDGNTLNTFFYEGNKNRGISSVIDLALAVDRPLAITKSNMFRHISHTEPSICIEDNSLQHIIQQGISPLEQYRKEWTTKNLCWDYERIISAGIQHYESSPLFSSNIKYLLQKTPARRLLKYLSRSGYRSVNRDKLMLAPEAVSILTGKRSILKKGLPLLFNETVFNRILDNRARKEYNRVIDLLFQLCPNEMSRKIAEANIQQAFVFETVRNFAEKFQNPEILSIGCYEDTAFLSLQKLGIAVDGIDPLLNYDLQTFLTKPGISENKFDIIFSTSVIEHVEDDVSFVADMARLLKPGGFVILTCDYKEDYKSGDKIPNVDFRFYTKQDLRHRLPSKMPGCYIFGTSDWDCAEPDFWFEGLNYTFATLVLQKKINQ